MSCALELLDAALGRADTYEALIAETAPAETMPASASGTAAPMPIGYICFGATPMTAATFDVYWIVVAPEAQGQGIGRALMAETERALAARGAETIRIETSSLEGQGGAVRFYERAGYARVGFIEAFYRPGDDLITLAKRLA
ncbi:MAG: GNAT family N-acetyltransferase [Pseudomonadota bacterium]